MHISDELPKRIPVCSEATSKATYNYKILTTVSKGIPTCVCGSYN